MIWWIVAAAVAVLVALKVLPLRVNMLGWFAAWALGIWVVLDFGFRVPVPQSVVNLYMGIVLLALVAYVSSDRERLRQVTGPTTAFLTEKRFTPYLAAVVLLVPAAVAGNIWLERTAPVEPPAFGRTVHPAPPDQIVVHEATLDLRTLDNPYRRLEDTDPDEFRRRVAHGREVYYSNCFFCHGDLLEGKGIYAHALNPIPTNFQDSGTISMFQESFIFWRISKGAPGLPAEGGPWDSAMPAWEKFLSEEEMWDVVLFLYDFTDSRPRARHETVVEGGEH